MFVKLFGKSIVVAAIALGSLLISMVVSAQQDVDQLRQELLDSKIELLKQEKKYIGMESLIQKQQAQIQQQQERLVSQDAKLAEQQQQIADQNVKIAKQQEEIASQNVKLAVQQQQIVSQNIQINALKQYQAALAASGSPSSVESQQQPQEEVYSSNTITITRPSNALAAESATANSVKTEPVSESKIVEAPVVIASAPEPVRVTPLLNSEPLWYQPEAWKRIRPGMTREEVESILGKPTKARKNIIDYVILSYRDADRNGSVILNEKNRVEYRGVRAPREPIN